MNIEESAERVKKWCEFYRLREKTNIDFLFSIAEKDIPIEAIETLLTAYEKEKEERERIGKLYYGANENCIKYEKMIKKEKEKNKELEDTLRCTQNSWYEDTKVIIDKDKLIEELKKYKK